MTASLPVWTWYKDQWHAGDVRILGAGSHGTWLGSVVFDGARQFERVIPDLDLHCERVNASARVLGLEPTLSAPQIMDLVREGLGRFAPDAAVYIRPMYWAEDGDPTVVAPDPASTSFALCLEERPMAVPGGFTITTTRFRRPAGWGCCWGNGPARLAPGPSAPPVRPRRPRLRARMAMTR